MDGKVEFTVPEEEFERVPVNGLKHGLKKRNNMYLPQIVRNVSAVQNAKIREDDLFVIGFPKSGKNIDFS